MEELSSNPDNVPHLVIDSHATSEQKAALIVLEQLAPYYGPVSLDSALTLIIETNAARVAEFDLETEEAILKDPHVQELISAKARAKDQEAFRNAIIKQRFIVFAGRLAAQSTQSTNVQPA